MADESSAATWTLEMTGEVRSAAASVEKERMPLSKGPLLLKSVEEAVKKYSVSASRLVRVIEWAFSVVGRERMKPSWSSRPKLISPVASSSVVHWMVACSSLL